MGLDTVDEEIAVAALEGGREEEEEVETHVDGAEKVEVLEVLLPLLGVLYHFVLSVTPRHSAKVTIL